MYTTGKKDSPETGIQAKVIETPSVKKPVEERKVVEPVAPVQEEKIPEKNSTPVLDSLASIESDEDAKGKK